MERQRYFAEIIDNEAVLNEDDVFHCTRVMRMKIGEELEIVCDRQVFIGVVKTLKPFRVEIIGKIKEKRELPNEIVLVATLLKGDKIDFVLQKAAELGVSEVILTDSSRSVIKLKESQKEAKLNRYRRILKEASEQSKRVTIPNLYRIIPFKDIDLIKADVKLIAYEEEAGSTKSFLDEIKKLDKTGRLAIIIGPEGGFTPEEIVYAKAKKYVPVSLGRRILRAETASVYALSVISAYLERK